MSSDFDNPGITEMKRREQLKGNQRARAAEALSNYEANPIIDPQTRRPVPAANLPIRADGKILG